MSSASSPTTLASLSAGECGAFVAALGGIFEHSPWVAEQAWDARPFTCVDELHGAMVAVVERAPHETRLALIRAHPELAGREAAAGTLTADSTGEQRSAGLDHCTLEELALLGDLNRRYRERFGFPFVMAVRGRSKAEIIAAMTARLGNDAGTESGHSLAEIAKITRMRLAGLLGA
jgi:2-oxo-4-hydroxy-4-carboxy-5-ureidoimidazoline decarboxylase